MPTPTSTSTPTPTAAPAAKKGEWCVPKAGLTAAQLQANLNYACAHGIDCKPIQSGGPCFQPDTLEAHATYAMNLYYHTAGQDPKNCDFSQTATLSSTSPSEFYLILSKFLKLHISFPFF